MSCPIGTSSPQLGSLALYTGHETSAGLLTFCVYFLIQHPDAMRRAHAEIDGVLGGQMIQSGDLSRLPYLTGMLAQLLCMTPSYAIDQPNSA